MTDTQQIEGIAAVIDIANLDTDQIMPKQFLRGIDKSGLDKGLLWDLRFDGEGHPRPDFVLNQPAFVNTRVLIASQNFGCGSSREHAVWGLQQYGIQAVIASSFGEIFYSNAMNNRLMAVMLPEVDVQALMREASNSADPLCVEIDVQNLTVRTANRTCVFAVSERHQRMFLDGLDMIGASLAYRAAIDTFAQRHWAEQPWTRDLARRTMLHLQSEVSAGMAGYKLHIL